MQLPAVKLRTRAPRAPLTPDGLAQAYILARYFLAGSPSAMVLGDNIFFGHGLPDLLARADASPAGVTVFGYHVADPKRYGVVELGPEGEVRAIIEKPEVRPSPYAVTGLYSLDGTAPDRAAEVKPSVRGELETTSLLESYLRDGALDVQRMGRGFAWLDTGTHASLLDAGNFVRTLTGFVPPAFDGCHHAPGRIRKAPAWMPGPLRNCVVRIVACRACRPITLLSSACDGTRRRLPQYQQEASSRRPAAELP